ncbi:MAG TPA: helix-turn-helix domain-containing protein [Steroidobacteraceae bacterium]|nr:helix-turn-helix domain-containing protein [Steroidobacteraceae bacterium]
MQNVNAEPKGVLDPSAAARKFRLARYIPADDLRTVIEHHWVVEWDLRGQDPYVQKTLPYPCVHLVFDAGKTTIHGVMRRTFEYRLTGAARVLGVRFRPGGFRGLLGAPVSTITDREISLEKIFNINPAEAEAALFRSPDDAGMVAVAEAIVRGSSSLCLADPNVEVVHGIVERIASDRTINKVEDLAPSTGLGIRALQRLFREYVGISPKWVIRRARLHDAAARLADAGHVNLTRLAHELGYSDQAHFTRDFKAVVGRSPSDYHRSARKPT